MQLELELCQEIKPKVVPTAGSVKFGVPFRFVDVPNFQLFIRVKPVNFLTNSTLLNDIFSRGDALVVNLATGTLGTTKGERVIKLVGCKIVHKAA
jgi:hypothetical protein